MYIFKKIAKKSRKNSFIVYFISWVFHNKTPSRGTRESNGTISLLFILLSLLKFWISNILFSCVYIHRQFNVWAFPVVKMSQRTRFGKASATSNKSPSKSKAKSRIKKPSIKKVSPTKRHNESTSTNLTQPRQKRLSSLTAAALVHYCTSILSPARKVTHAKKTSPKNVRPQSNCSKSYFLFYL